MSVEVIPRPVLASLGETGQAQWTCPTSFGQAWVVDSAKKIDPSLLCSALTNYVRDGRFYVITERTLADQFDQRYFILKNERENKIAVQPFFFARQDLTAGLPSSQRRQILRLRSLFGNFLFLQILMVGCPAGEGDLDSTEQWAVVSLREALDAYERVTKPTVTMLKDFSAKHRQILGEFRSHGYQRIPGMPAAELDLNFTSFEEYMRTRLGKVFRKSLRRKFKVLNRVPPLRMEVVRDASPIIDEIFPLYRQVYDRAQMTFDALNKDYFLALGHQMPDKTRFFVWRQNGRVIAFNLCLIHDRTLYDLGVGFDYSVALQLHLYFVTFRDVIQWCIENGVKTYHAGSLDYDPKLHLKLRLVPQDIYARFKPHWLNRPLQFAISYFAPIRYEPLLRKFANAHEL
jgi:hypothetical protein